MEIFGLTVERKMAKTPTEFRPSQTGVVGRTGTLTWSGRLFEEYMTDLAGRVGCVTYDKMRRSDPQVGMTLRAMKHPIYQAKWSVVPSEDDEDMGEQIALAVEKMLFAGGRAGWRSVLRHACLMLDFGFSVLEEDWQVRDRPDYMAKLGAPPKMLWLAGLEPRLPQTIDQWLGLDQPPYKLTGIQQVLLTAGKNPPPIPVDNALIFTNEREGDNYEGRSILRSAYKPWYYAEMLEKFDAIGLERAAIGIPEMHYDALEGISADDAEKRGRDILQHLNASEQGYMVTMPYQTFKLHGNEYKNDAIRASIRSHQRQVAVNAIMQFMELGAEGGAGSRATASEQRGPFDLAELALADEIGETISDQTIQDIVRYNWGERPGYPSLQASGVLDTNMKEMAEIINNLSQSGTLIPDDRLEDWAREMCNMPKAIRPKGHEPEQHKKPEPEAAGQEPAPGSPAPKLEGDPKPDKAPGVDPDAKAEPEEKPKTPNAKAMSFWREPTDAERFVAFTQIKDDLDGAKEQFIERVGATARDIGAVVAANAARYVQAQNAGRLAVMQAPSQQKLVSKIKGEIQPLVAYGRRTVREERERARAGIPASSIIDARREGDRGYASADGEDLLSDEGIVFWQNLKASRRAQVIVDLILTACIDVGLRLIRTGFIKLETLLQALQEAADTAADRGVLNAAGLLISEAFGMGRGAEIADQIAQGGVTKGIYSALIDPAVCEECERLDGLVFYPGEPEFEKYMDGNAENCYGGDRCRCMLFLEYADMVQPVV